MEIKEIAQKIQTELSTLTPREVDDYRTILSGWYYQGSEELALLEVNRPEKWYAIKMDVKTNHEADLMYDCTPDGKRRIELKYKLRAIEKLIGALKDRLQRLNSEARYQY